MAGGSRRVGALNLGLAADRFFSGVPQPPPPWRLPPDRLFRKPLLGLWTWLGSQALEDEGFEYEDDYDSSTGTRLQHVVDSIQKLLRGKRFGQGSHRAQGAGHREHVLLGDLA